MYLGEILNIPFGIRYIGYWGNGSGYQVPISNYNDIKEFINRYLGLKDIGISISAYKNGAPYLLFLPFDFDAVNLKDSWKEAKTLFNYFSTAGYNTYLIFSGNKGFHVLVSTIPKVYSKKQIRSIQLAMKTLFNLNTLDEQIFGDVRRLMRVPYTYNLKGELCRVIAYNKGRYLDLELVTTSDIYAPYYFSEDNDSVSYHDYPCIESLVRSDIEPRHIVRFTFVILRISEGYTDDEIIDEIESFGWVDFDEEYTRRQIEHIRSRKYAPPSCKTLKELGYCIVKNCEYDPDTTVENLKKVGLK